jgi:chemotaxis protein MotB
VRSRQGNRRAKKSQPVEEGAPAWMTTYSDMITLVLAFFVLLFSFAVIEEAKFNEIMSSMRLTFLGAEGILEGSPDPADLPDSFFEKDPLSKDTEELMESIETFIQERNLAGTIGVELDERGIILVISDAILFEPARADLLPEARYLLSYVGEMIDDIPNQVLVEGHTDNVPIHTPQFPSNWELSVARAVIVVRYLSERMTVEPHRLAAVGHSEYHPVASNKTAEGRHLNRRVNIIISKMTHEDF